MRGHELAAKCIPGNYELSAASSSAELAAYDAFLEETYSTLGFLLDKVRPGPDAERFALRFRGALAGICCLTEVSNPGSVYHHLIPALARPSGPARLVELNNFILKPEYRGTVALGLMVAGAARRASERGFDYLVGTMRYQALPYFVEFGVVPVEHPPLHVLGDGSLHDFVVYYDTHSPESMAYLEQRTRRYLHQVQVMTAIREKYFRRSEAAGASAAAEARG